MKLAILALILVAGFAAEIHETLLVQEHMQRCRNAEVSFFEAARMDNPRSHVAVNWSSLFSSTGC